MTVTLRDDPGLIQQYEAYHSAVWPEVLEGIRKAGIRRNYIFRHERLLFMYMETDDDFDPDRDLAEYTKTNPRAREWDELMRTFQEPLPGAAGGATWGEMKEVCTIDFVSSDS